MKIGSIELIYCVRRKNDQRLRDLKCTNLHMVGIRSTEEEAERIFEKRIPENSANLMNNINLHIQG